VILLSQDVLPVDEDVLSHLVASFAGHPEVAACYGRQLPDRDARVFMRIKRAYLYPETSEIRSFADRERLGFRTTLMSNSFAAYRRDALESVGWFGDRRLVCEDVATTARLLLEGWQVRYVAEAVVEHAHHSAAIDELRRYFDIGAFHAHDPWIIESFGRPRREGWRYARHGVERLLREGRAALVVPFVVSCAAKRVAFTLGRHHDRLPKALRPLLSTRPTWWRAQSPTGSAVNPGSTREKSPPSGPPAR
jgi:rhamnosyltransferase